MGVTKEVFESWALSPEAGMFGDPDGDYAFCGIEPGRHGDSRITEEEFQGGIAKSKCLGEAGFLAECATYKDWPVGNWISKTVMLIDDKIKNEFCKRGISRSDGASRYQRECLFKRGEAVFQANLYPLPFRRINSKDWQASGAPQHTGFETKRDYRDWCVNYRFDRLREFILKESKAKMLVCFGKGQWKEFAHMLKVPCPDKTARFDVQFLEGKQIVFIPFLGNGQISHKCLEDCFKKST